MWTLPAAIRQHLCLIEQDKGKFKIFSGNSPKQATMIITVNRVNLIDPSLEYSGHLRMPLFTHIYMWSGVGFPEDIRTSTSDAEHYCVYGRR